MDTSGVPRVYFSDKTGALIELAPESGLGNTTNLPGKVRTDSSSIVSYLANGSEPRVYYIAADGTVHELSRTNGSWTDHALGGNETRRRSQICCIPSGNHAIIYYIDSKMVTNELLFSNGSWSNTGWV